MTHSSSPFRSPQGEAAFLAAYDATMRLWTIPYEVIDLRSRFGSTRVVACGPRNAPPVVLLHCFFTSLAVWANNVADLARGHRVYAVDMMGQPGRSIPAEPIRTRDDLAEWLGTVVDSLELPRFALAGYSYGGFAALNFGIRRPERVERLVLLTPVGSFVPVRVQFYLRGLLVRIPGLTRPGMNSFFDWMFDRANLEKANVKPLAESVRELMVLGMLHFRLGAIVPPMPFADDELRALRIPVMLLIGDRETLYDAQAALDRARRLVPDARMQLIAGAGHDLPVGLAERVNPLMLAFLAAETAVAGPASGWTPVAAGA